MILIPLLLLAASLQAQTIRTVCASGCDYALTALQTAIDDASPGDIIEIGKGLTATRTGGGPYNLPAKGGSSFVTIRSSGVTNLTPGARVGPADAANLAKLTIAISPGPWAVISNSQGASWYRFHGIEITAPAGFTGDLVEFGTRTPTVSYVSDSQIADLAHHIVFDQCWIHGDSASTDGPRRGIRSNLGSMEVRNSTIENFKNQNGESNAIGGWHGSGPFYFENNHLEAAAITTLFGGAEPNIKGLRANGLFFRGNYYYRRWAWRKRIKTTAPSGTCLYDANGGEYWHDTSAGKYYRCDSGTWVEITSGEMIAYVWQKNIFELKNSWRSWVDGNYMENAWNPAAQNQYGAMFLFNLVDADPPSTNEPAATVGYVSIKNNYGRRTPWLVSIGSIGTTYFRWHNNINIENNVFDEIGDSPYTLAAAETNGSKWGGSFMTFGARADRLAYTHNTMISRAPVEARSGFLYGSAGDSKTAGAVIAGNIFPFNKYGMYNDVDGGNLWNSIPNGLANGYAVSRNLIVNNESQTSYGKAHPIINWAYNNDSPSSPMPCVGSTNEMTGSGATYNGACAFPAAYSDIGFTDYSAKNYKLSGSSSYLRWGPLGRSPGADTDVVGWSTSGVNSAGATLNSYLKAGPIRRVIPGQTGVAFRYTAPTVAACTTTMSTKPDLSSPIINALGDGGGDLDRFQVDVNGLSTNTRYYWRITCGDSTYREGIVTTLP